MSPPISRHFVSLAGRWGNRQVHYRRAGTGPLLLMLHQSPQSSRELVPLIERWAEFFTIVAPDSPGYGLSDPLGVDQAELHDFANATIEFMDAIGAARFGIYGFHTGGMIGIAIAAHYAERVMTFACNGVAVPTDAELAEILKQYFPPFAPRWDGGHLTWLWAKTREQTVFFPWHNRTLAGRMDFSMPTPEHQQNSVLEFLRAGEHYAIAYHAAFMFHAERVVPYVNVPGLITAADWDPLQPHLARLSEAPAGIKVEPAETAQDAVDRCLRQLTAHPGDALEPAAPTGLIAGQLTKSLVETATGSILVRRGGHMDRTPLVLLHGAGQSGDSVATFAAQLADQSATIAIDLPGHGESDARFEAAGCTIRACALAVADVLRKFDLQHVDLFGVAAGAFVAVELSKLAPDLVGRIVMMEPPLLDSGTADQWLSDGLPDFTPDWHGGHLLRCWHMVRDSRLYFPWFRRDRIGIRWHEPQLDLQEIQREVTDFLKADGAWQQLVTDQFHYPLLEQLSSASQQTTICASPQSPWSEASAEFARRLDLPFVPLDTEVTGLPATRL